MPVKSPARRKRQTWRDWLPPDIPEPDRLMTRSELLAELHSEGVEVSTHDLDNWQVAGIIPYGLRRRHEGANRTLYPQWMIGTIRYLRELQDAGKPLSEIGAMLRVHARIMAGIDTATQRSTATTPTSAPAGSFRAISVHDTLTVDLEETASVVKTTAPRETLAAVPDDIASRLREWAREHERLFGTKITRADVSLVDEYGHPLTFQFDT